jgi:hypothetical protein
MFYSSNDNKTKAMESLQKRPDVLSTIYWTRKSCVLLSTIYWTRKSCVLLSTIYWTRETHVLLSTINWTRKSRVLLSTIYWTRETLVLLSTIYWTRETHVLLSTIYLTRETHVLLSTINWTRKSCVLLSTIYWTRETRVLLSTIYWLLNSFAFVWSPFTVWHQSAVNVLSTPHDRLLYSRTAVPNTNVQTDISTFMILYCLEEKGTETCVWHDNRGNISRVHKFVPIKAEYLT